ncbi:YxlC family protein [Paenibacillus agricola]|uniref:YxlC family protein n=1 Tax=Paenibacillus agricola TaxID=2716264 RepID=A0ABX0J125_9BACL|nr:YxlC family protein [Paenibacillus agricola]NHN29992.1 YxlC family protein [Paenibacillus agricola]
MVKHNDSDHEQLKVHRNHLSDVPAELSQDDQRTVSVLHNALDSLDSHIPIMTPSSEWFQQQILLRQAQRSKRLLRELFMFVFVAIGLLSAFISAALQEPSLFLLVQLASLIIAPIVIVLLPRKQVGA